MPEDDEQIMGCTTCGYYSENLIGLEGLNKTKKKTPTIIYFLLINYQIHIHKI